MLNIKLLNKMCFGKQSFNSKKEALERIEKIREQAILDNYGYPPASLQVYKCKFCSKWHLGNKKQ